MLAARPIQHLARLTHRLGVVHRDLKPENMFLHRNTDKKWVPKVGDFGLAKRPLKATMARTLSVSYALIGALEHRAPEQIQNPGLVDRRVDVFSLGAIYNERGTGEVAFDAEEPKEVLEFLMSAVFPSVSSQRSGVPPGHRTAHSEPS